MKNTYKQAATNISLFAGLGETRFITREKLKEYSKMHKVSYPSLVGYLLANRYLVRILRGIFYINTTDERKKKVTSISFNAAISEALKLKGVKKWYFGLESAIKLNNLTHEYFAVDFIISDKLKRPAPLNILGHKVRFIKVKSELLEFGIKGDKVPYSDIEKTILDIIYLGIYNGYSENNIKNRIIDYLDNADKKKLEEYSKFYPKSAIKLIKGVK